MNIKTSLGNATRRLFLSSIMKQSGNYLPLTNREKTMIKWFLKFSFTVVFCASAWTMPIMALKSHVSHVKSLEAQIPVIEQKTAPVRQEITKTAIPEAKAEVYEVVAKTYRTVTAYNVGDPNQTDDSPCIGASTKDLCKMLEAGHKVVAANFVPLGTKLRVNGQIYEVWDRMASKHGQKVDIAMRLDEKERAVKFGSQVLEVEILK